MEAAWKLTVPVDRDGKKLVFECKDLGIDAFMAIQSFIQAKKWKEAFILFFNETRVGGSEVKELQAEFDKDNMIPFGSCLELIPKFLEPIPGEIKKN